MAIDPGPGCKVPRRKDPPDWVPAQLPLPKDVYFYRALDKRGAFDRGLFVTEMDTTRFRRFVRREWPVAGVVLSRQDREPGEVEALFTTSGGTGLFKANDVLCTPRYTRLLLIYGE